MDKALLYTIDNDGIYRVVVGPEGKVPVYSFGARQIEEDVLATYGDKVQLNQVGIFKFGENPDLGTTESTVMELPSTETEETYVSTNAITHIVSDAGDSLEFTIQGQELQGTDLVNVTQTVTTNGNTPVALSTPLARASRAWNSDSTDMTPGSKVYIMEGTAVTGGVPDTGSEVHLIISAQEQQSLKAALAFSGQEYGVITEMYASVTKKTAIAAIIRLKVREQDGVFRTRFKVGVNSAGSGSIIFPLTPYLVIPKNADVIITAEASATGSQVAAGFNAYTADII